MTPDEAVKAYKENIQWLKENLDENEIYVFAEQALCCAEFFLQKWHEWEDVAAECEKDAKTKAWVTNIINVRRLKDLGFKQGLSTKLKWFKD